MLLGILSSSAYAQPPSAPPTPFHSVEPTGTPIRVRRASLSLPANPGQRTPDAPPVPVRPSTTVSSTAFTAARLPLDSLRVTSPFGYRRDPGKAQPGVQFHAGLDLQAGRDSVRCWMAGEVTKVAYDPRLGMYVKVRHPLPADASEQRAAPAYESIYGHLSCFFVREGQFLAAGHLLGMTGHTGRATGNHLHFALRYRGHYVDPLPYLQWIVKQSHRPDSSEPVKK
ncbi:M23 family metallopeptidase [Catalinimonas alkaloidigena]|uniref:M23 family metallopeptidase n=1 Tax=Catalinimonas alkaloidigena TaxID=1075417 RepID=UPI003977D13A